MSIPPSLPNFIERLRALFRPSARARDELPGAPSSTSHRASPAADPHEGERRRLEMEAELRVLRGYLNPLFLFNALSTLNHAMHRDMSEADATLRQILNLLRGVLAKTNDQLVPLDVELQRVRELLARWSTAGARAPELRLNIADEAREARVPPLLLASLVAGLATHGGNVKQSVFAIAAHREPAGDSAGLLSLTVVRGIASASRDGAPSIEPSLIAALERRLQQHFGIQASASVRRQGECELAVDIAMPWIAEPVPAIVGSL